MALRVFPGTTVLEAGDVTTISGTHFSVFTPYYRSWRQAPRRAVEEVPRRLVLPSIDVAAVCRYWTSSSTGQPSPELPAGGEAAGRKRLAAWLRTGLVRYDHSQDDLAADATSRLSPYLHFGCLSPLEVAESRFRCRGRRVVRAPARVARLLPPAPGRAARNLA